MSISLFPRLRRYHEICESSLAMYPNLFDRFGSVLDASHGSDVFFAVTEFTRADRFRKLVRDTLGNVRLSLSVTGFAVRLDDIIFAKSLIFSNSTTFLFLFFFFFRQDD